MTIEQLQEILEDYLHAGGSADTEVRFMGQYSWPFEYSISGEFIPGLVGDEDEDGEKFEGQPTQNGAPALYLTEGTQLGYGTKAAWDNC